MLSGCSRTFARPLLMVILVVAVLGMHHLLFWIADADVHGAGAHHIRSTAESVSSTDESVTVRFLPADSAMSAPCCDLPTVAPSEGVSAGRAGTPAGEHHGGHDLLHLCLAIMAAIAGVVLMLTALIQPLPARVQRRGPSLGIGGFARPPPGSTLRRLAVLCVLRQ